MAITLPYGVVDFWETFHLVDGSSELELLTYDQQSMDGGGNFISAKLADAKWTADINVAPQYDADAKALEAKINILRGGDGAFLLYDKRRPYPASDPDGSKLGNGSLVAVGGEAAYGDVTLGTYRYEGNVVTLAQAASAVGDAGTYFDADGVLQTSAVNTLRIDYGPFANLLDLRYVKAFDNAYWVKSGLSVTANSLAAPDGTTTADTITVGGSGQGIYAIVSVAASSQYTFSFYVRLGTMAAADFKMAFRDDTAGVFIASNVVPTQTPVASGWTRISYTLTTPVGCLSLRVYPFRNDASVTGTAYLWGAVLNAGSTALTYPRVPLGIRVERSFTSVLTYSEELDNAAWTKTRTTITANAALAPSGASTADKILDSVDVTTTHQVQQNFASFTSGSTYVVSGFFKASELRYVQLALNGAAFSTVQRGLFDLLTGATSVAQGAPTLAAENCGDGWWRVSLSAVATSSGSAAVIIYLTDAAGSVTFTGTGSAGVFAWGLQMNLATQPYSYVARTSATIVRAADALTIRGKGTNDWTVTFDNDATQAFNDDAGDFTPAASALSRQWVKKWTSTRDTQPAEASVQIKSKGSNNRSIALKGLPPFYALKAGERLSITNGTTLVGLFEISEDVTADYLGETVEFELQPFLPTWITVDQAVTLAKAPGKFKIIRGSYKRGTIEARRTVGKSFQIISSYA